MKSKKKNTIIKLLTCIRTHSKANSERTLQSICNVIFEIIKYYISTTFRMTILQNIAFNFTSIHCYSTL